jgi:hypothetical protein
MKRLGWLVGLAACSHSAAEKPQVAERPKIEAGAFGGFHVSRTKCENLIGVFEPVVTMEETVIRYTWRFRLSPEVYRNPLTIYVDTAKSGLDLGRWYHKMVTAVGRVREDEVGYERAPGLTEKRPIVAPVMELVSIDTDLKLPEGAEIRVKPGDEYDPSKQTEVKIVPKEKPLKEPPAKTKDPSR